MRNTVFGTLTPCAISTVAVCSVTIMHCSVQVYHTLPEHGLSEDDSMNEVNIMHTLKM